MDVQFPRNVGAANKMLAGAVSRAVGAGHTLVMLGGDHRYLLKNAECAVCQQHLP